MRSPNTVRGGIARIPFATLPAPASAPAAIALFALGAIGFNSLLGVAAIVVFVIGSSLLWRPREAPILLFILGYQWFQASAAIFHANWLGVTVSEVSTFSSRYGGDVNLAITLSLSGLLALAIGMRVGAGRGRPQIVELARNVAERTQVRHWFFLYGAAWLVATAAQSVALIVPGLTQPLLALAKLKWAFFFIVAYVTFVRPGANRTYWMVAFGIELVLAMGSYFSDFKTVFFFTLFALIAAGARPSLRQAVGLSLLGGILLAFAVMWTAIKAEYRTFVSGASTDQAVAVDRVTALGKMYDLMSQLDGERLSAAADKLVRRLAYVDLFGVVVETVPRRFPHENGAIWLDALSRPFTPRLLFAEKSAIDDSTRTRLYTGIHVAGAEQGTSISLGYMAESYIDFGQVGMTLPIFFLGLTLGRICRWMLVDRNSRGILGIAFGTATCFSVAFLESSITKSIGNLAVTLLVSWVIIRFLAPRYFPWALASGNEGRTKRYSACDPANSQFRQFVPGR